MEFLSDRKHTKGVFIWPLLHFNEKIQGDIKVKWEDEDQTKATKYGSYTAAIQNPNSLPRKEDAWRPPRTLNNRF